MEISIGDMLFIANIIIFTASYSSRKHGSNQVNDENDAPKTHSLPSTKLIKPEFIKAQENATADEISAVDYNYSLKIMDPIFIIDVVGSVKVTDNLFIAGAKVEFPSGIKLTVESVGKKVRLAVINDKLYFLSCKSFSIA